MSTNPLRRADGTGALIRFRGVTRVYGRGPASLFALNGVDLDIMPRDFVAVMGPSGSGKSTSMNIMGCLDAPTSGEYIVAGRHVERLSRDQRARLRRRYIGFVFQGFNLLSRTSALDNVELPLLYGNIGLKTADRHKRAHEMLELVGLGNRADHHPNQLSGGQQQRVGVARALAADPPVLLMDEPFSAVDPIVRATLQDELTRLQGELHKTVVLVTHDVEEAIKVGDLVAVWYPHGKIAQIDTPERLLGAPADDYVENFLGFDRGIRRLAFFPAAGLDLETETVLGEDVTVEQARQAAKRAGASWVLVTSAERHPRGWAALTELESASGGGTLGQLTLAPYGHTFRVGQDSLRAALDATVLSRTGLAVGVDGEGRVVGVTSYERLRAAIQGAEEAADREGARTS